LGLIAGICTFVTRTLLLSWSAVRHGSTQAASTESAGQLIPILCSGAQACLVHHAEHGLARAAAQVPGSVMTWIAG